MLTGEGRVWVVYGWGTEKNYYSLVIEEPCDMEALLAIDKLKVID